MSVYFKQLFGLGFVFCLAWPNWNQIVVKELLIITLTNSFSIEEDIFLLYVILLRKYRVNVVASKVKYLFWIQTPQQAWRK